MTTRADTHRVASDLARGLTQLWTLGLISEGGRGVCVAERLDVVRDALTQTQSGALAGYGASDTAFALDVWHLVQRLIESGSPFSDMDNTELAGFFDKLRKAEYGPQVSHALARWLPSRMFISAQYTKQHLEKLRPTTGRSLAGWATPPR
ncbi:MAG: hypothetical protein M3Z04_17690 [Chloroflexota bacterium]|nr:hypothetical protein [Chloroflexota bacterium]